MAVALTSVLLRMSPRLLERGFSQPPIARQKLAIFLEAVAVLSERKSRISLTMIVRDEERNLGQCLAPVASLFDEIVIVDTGSRDQTRSIARQYTPHVFDFPWTDDFSAARNEALR